MGVASGCAGEEDEEVHVQGEVCMQIPGPAYFWPKNSVEISRSHVVDNSVLMDVCQQQ